MFGWLKKQKQIDKLQKEIDQLKFLLDEKNVGATDEPAEMLVVKNGKEKVVEGVYNGCAMVGDDGRQYDVPANYASKSKLVEGDLLKLTITNSGSFIFKQIKPIGRERCIGVLEREERDMQYYARKDGKRWKLLTASVTYFKGVPGDEVIFLVPKFGDSQWAAVENILNK
ncbi:MAG: hypothetical protein V1902_02280 [Candidatus Falkowbacteria bacterium]